jgi:hypothetical protein
MKRKMIFNCPLCSKKISIIINHLKAEETSIEPLYCEDFKKTIILKCEVFKEYEKEYTIFSFRFENKLKSIVAYLRGDEKEGDYINFQRNINEKGINYYDIND